MPSEQNPHPMSYSIQQKCCAHGRPVLFKPFKKFPFFIDINISFFPRNLFTISK